MNNYEDQVLKTAMDTKLRESRMTNQFIATVPYTPIDLCREIFSKIPLITERRLSAKIAVLFTVEMAVQLNKWGFTDVTLITDVQCDKCQNIAVLNGFAYKTVEQIKEMKFDVVVGNPPYQADAKSKNTRLWMEFINLAHTISNEYVALITPANWTTTTNLYEKWFKQHNPIYINIGECARHFPQVNITFSAFVVQLNKPSHLCTFVTANGEFVTQLPTMPPGLNFSEQFNSILTKLLDNTALICRQHYTHHTQASLGKVSKIRTPQHQVPVLLSPTTSKKQEVWGWGKSECVDMIGPRVVGFNFTGGWKTNLFVSDSGVQTSHNYLHFPTHTVVEAENLLAVLTSNVYTYLTFSLNSIRGISGKTMSRLPSVDLKRSWTDAELYAHFNLTQEEIDLIEATV